MDNTTRGTVVCAGPGCTNRVDPDNDGFHCSTECLLSEMREHGDLGEQGAA